MTSENDPQRRVLESKLQGILSELSVVCGQLGISLGEGTQPKPASSVPPPKHPSSPPPQSLTPGLLLLTRLNGWRVGFISTEVQEVARMVALAPSIDPRPELEGYVNVRGEAIPVVNLRFLLGGGEVPHDPDQFLLLFSVKNIKLAIIVDEVSDIYMVEEKQIQSRESMELRQGFVHGIAVIDKEIVGVINPLLLAERAL